MAVAILMAIFASILLPLLSGKHWRAEQDRARARRTADAKMNARLLRLHIDLFVKPLFHITERRPDLALTVRRGPWHSLEWPYSTALRDRMEFHAECVHAGSSTIDHVRRRVERLVPVLEARSLVAQADHRIDSGGTPCRHGAGQERHGG